MKRWSWFFCILGRGYSTIIGFVVGGSGFFWRNDRNNFRGYRVREKRLSGRVKSGKEGVRYFKLFKVWMFFERSGKEGISYLNILS